MEAAPWKCMTIYVTAGEVSVRQIGKNKMLTSYVANLDSMMELPLVSTKTDIFAISGRSRI